MNKVYVWLLAIMMYLAMFGTPLVAGYYLFAEQIDATTGGMFFYFVGFAVFIFFIRKLLVSIRKQKAGYIKAIFKFMLSFATFYVAYSFVSYIEANFGDLAIVLLAATGGRILAFVFEILAIKIDREYVNEIGVI